MKRTSTFFIPVTNPSRPGAPIADAAAVCPGPLRHRRLRHAAVASADRVRDLMAQRSPLYNIKRLITRPVVGEKGHLAVTGEMHQAEPLLSVCEESFQVV